MTPSRTNFYVYPTNICPGYIYFFSYYVGNVLYKLCVPMSDWFFFHKTKGAFNLNGIGLLSHESIHISNTN